MELGGSPHIYHINWERGQLPNPNECNSTLTSETRGETLTPNPNECHSTLASAIRGIYLFISLYIPSELGMILRHTRFCK